jgi:hypothetical protein
MKPSFVQRLRVELKTKVTEVARQRQPVERHVWVGTNSSHKLTTHRRQDVIGMNLEILRVMPSVPSMLTAVAGEKSDISKLVEHPGLRQVLID